MLMRKRTQTTVIQLHDNRYRKGHEAKFSLDGPFPVYMNMVPDLSMLKITEKREKASDTSELPRRNYYEEAIDEFCHKVHIQCTNHKRSIRELLRV